MNTLTPALSRRAMACARAVLADKAHHQTQALYIAAAIVFEHSDDIHEVADAETMLNALREHAP